MRAIPIFLMLLLLVSCDINLCSNDLIDEVTSPSGKYVASTFERNCGATTPYISIVSLRSANTKFTPEDHENWVFKIRGRSSLEVSWVAIDKIKISYSGTGNEATQRMQWREIAVSYD